MKESAQFRKRKIVTQYNFTAVQLVQYSVTLCLVLSESLERASVIILDQSLTRSQGLFFAILLQFQESAPICSYQHTQIPLTNKSKFSFFLLQEKKSNLSKSNVRFQCAFMILEESPLIGKSYKYSPDSSTLITYRSQLPLNR